MGKTNKPYELYEGYDILNVGIKEKLICSSKNLEPLYEKFLRIKNKNSKISSVDNDAIKTPIRYFEYIIGYNDKGEYVTLYFAEHMDASYFKEKNL